MITFNFRIVGRLKSFNIVMAISFIYRGRQHTNNIFIVEKNQNDNDFHKKRFFTHVYEGFYLLSISKFRSVLQDYGIIYCKLSVEKWILYGVYYYDSVIHWLNWQQKKIYWNLCHFMRPLKYIENNVDKIFILQISTTFQSHIHITKKSLQ